MSKLKLNIGQKIELTEDMPITGGLSGDKIALPKGTPLFVGADKKFFYMLNGKMLKINEAEWGITGGYSVTGLAEWLYQRLSHSWGIDEMLEEAVGYDDTQLSDQVKEFKKTIGEALEDLGMYDHTGNTL